MADLRDGEVAHVQGSASKPYELKNSGGVYSCSCPAWRNQSVGIESRTCKHLRKLRGDAAENARLGTLSAPAAKPEADRRPDPAFAGTPQDLSDAIPRTLRRLAG